MRFAFGCAVTGVLAGCLSVGECVTICFYNVVAVVTRITR